MANELKIGNKLVVLNNALSLASLATDPVSAVNGDFYYNSNSNVFRVYQNGSWLTLQAGGSITLTGQTLNTANIIVGDGSNLSAAVDSSSVGDILAHASNGLTIKSAVIDDSMISSSAAVSRIKIASGNTNRIVINSDIGALADANAITAARALISDANGIPTHSVTTLTELAFLSGVTSAVQTQVDSKVAKMGDSLTGSLLFATTFGVDSTAGGSPVLNIGNANADVINIGHAGATVNILGAVEYVQATNLQVTDSLITLNKDGAAASAIQSGIEIEENSIITAYLQTANSRNSWDLKAPATAGTVRFTPGALSIIIDQNLAVAASPTFVSTTLSGATASTATVFNGSKQLTSSVTTLAELAFLSGVTSAVQTQLDNKAGITLNNLGTTSINSALLPSGNNTLGLGSAGLNWTTMFAKNLNSSTDATVLANSGSGNFNVTANKFRRSKDSTNYVETEYVDSTALSANVSSPTAISGFSFAFASFNGCIVEYTIKEATTGNIRIGRFMVSTDSSSVSSSDIFSETAALGSALGLSLDAAINGSNIDIRYNNTHASNACTIRADIKRLRA